MPLHVALHHSLPSPSYMYGRVGKCIPCVVYGSGSGMALGDRRVLLESVIEWEVRWAG